VDTAYPYHGGQSEEFLGRALKGEYRRKVKIADKLPCWEVKELSDCDRLLETQLKRLQADEIDFYLLHSLGRDSFKKMIELGVIEWAEKARKAGKFRWLGFSFHDDYEAFRTIIDAYNWDMCQIQYNYMDIENQAGTRGLEYAASKNVPVVVMEPLLGGRLCTPPGEIKALWRDAETQRTPAGWALHWLWDRPDVTCVLSGMSAFSQAEENIALADDAEAGAFSTGEHSLIDRAREMYKKLMVIPCTQCRYCLPCPHHVDIPGNIAAYNDGVMYNNPGAARGTYHWWKFAHEDIKILPHDVRAVRCAQCGECDDKCPQSIPIRSWMPVIHRVLGENGDFVSSPS
jgi:predicted aldo/keto reductase-like oxidoreductase